MSYTQSRTMTTSLLGPTKQEMDEFLAGISGDTRISIHYDKGYNQLDPGSITFTVNEKPKTQPKGDTVLGGYRDR